MYLPWCTVWTIGFASGCAGSSMKRLHKLKIVSKALHLWIGLWRNIDNITICMCCFSLCFRIFIRQNNPIWEKRNRSFDWTFLLPLISTFKQMATRSWNPVPIGKEPTWETKGRHPNRKKALFFETLPKLRCPEGVGRVVLLRMQFYHSLLQIFRLSLLTPKVLLDHLRPMITIPSIQPFPSHASIHKASLII